MVWCIERVLLRGEWVSATRRYNKDNGEQTLQFMHDRCRWVGNREGGCGREGFRKHSRLSTGVKPGAQNQHDGTFPKVSNPPIASKPKNPGLFQLGTRSTLAVGFSNFTILASW